jgi:hypothetical protein
MTRNRILFALVFAHCERGPATKVMNLAIE